jgi:hypothetical protein
VVARLPEQVTRSAAWDPFADSLAAHLAALEEDQYLVLSTKEGNRFVQYAAQTGGMRVETTSNEFLSGLYRLDSRRIEILRTLGWTPPTGTLRTSNPLTDPDGSCNFFRDLVDPIDWHALAELTVRTFVEAHLVPHPNELEYTAWDDYDSVILLPMLGLKRGPRTGPPVGKPVGTTWDEARWAVLDALATWVGHNELAFDEGDESLGVVFNGVEVLVFAPTGRPFVRFVALAAPDAERDLESFERINEFNTTAAFVALFVDANDNVVAAGDLPVEGVTSANARMMIEQVLSLASAYRDSLPEDGEGAETGTESTGGYL